MSGSNEPHPTENSIPAAPEWGPLRAQENLEEMLDAWQAYEGPNVGWCLLCNNAIKSHDDLIPGTNTHDCVEGRRLCQEDGSHTLCGLGAADEID